MRCARAFQFSFPPTPPLSACAAPKGFESLSLTYVSLPAPPPVLRRPRRHRQGRRCHPLAAADAPRLLARTAKPLQAGVKTVSRGAGPAHVPVQPRNTCLRLGVVSGSGRPVFSAGAGAAACVLLGQVAAAALLSPASPAPAPFLRAGRAGTGRSPRARSETTRRMRAWRAQMEAARHRVGAAGGARDRCAARSPVRCHRSAKKRHQGHSQGSLAELISAAFEMNDRPGWLPSMILPANPR